MTIRYLPGKFVIWYYCYRIPLLVQKISKYFAVADHPGTTICALHQHIPDARSSTWHRDDAEARVWREYQWNCQILSTQQQWILSDNQYDGAEDVWTVPGGSLSWHHIRRARDDSRRMASRKGCWSCFSVAQGESFWTINLPVGVCLVLGDSIARKTGGSLFFSFNFLDLTSNFIILKIILSYLEVDANFLNNLLSSFLIFFHNPIGISPIYWLK